MMSKAKYKNTLKKVDNFFNLNNFLVNLLVSIGRRYMGAKLLGRWGRKIPLKIFGAVQETGE